jgi:hypothetical protein
MIRLEQRGAVAFSAWGSRFLLITVWEYLF